jgi:hypothetical protein
MTMNNRLPPELAMMGALEDADDDERMVVRVLGRRLGTSHGWVHMGGWCVMAPEFKPETSDYGVDGFKDHKHLALVIDYYTGHMLLLSDVESDGPTGKWKVLLSKMLDGEKK